MAAYRKLEREFFVRLEGADIRVINVSARDTKLLQFAGGTVIHDTETKAWIPVHDAKLEALDDLLEDLGGRPLLLAYQFRADMYRIRERYAKKYKTARSSIMKGLQPEIRLSCSQNPMAP